MSQSTNHVHDGSGRPAASPLDATTPEPRLVGEKVLFEELAAAIDAVAPERPPLALLLVDVDRFGEVNEALGRRHGNLLLDEIAARIRTELRSDAVLGHLGGDDFAVLLPSVTDAGVACTIARRLRDALARPLVAGELMLEVTASVGVVLHPDHGDGPNELLRHAEAALEASRRDGTRVALYDAESDPGSPDRGALIAELRRAIEESAIDVHYQPQVNPLSGETVAVEALVRWNEPRHGSITPTELIRLAEQSGLIRPLTLYAIEHALNRCAEWERRGLDLSVAVNLSPHNLLDRRLPEDLAERIRLSGAPAKRLVLEVPERAVMSGAVGAEQAVARLSAVGVGIAVDNFGSSYASFLAIRRLAVDTLKVDRSLVESIVEDDDAAAVLRSIFSLGKTLGVTVVASGVESEAVLAKLPALGCDRAQGFCLSRPVSSTELERRLQESSWGLLDADVPRGAPTGPPAGVQRLV